MSEEPKDPRTSGKVAMYALLGLALFTFLFIYFAG